VADYAIAILRVRIVLVARVVCDTLSLKCWTLLFDRKELLWNLIILWLRIAAICLFFWVTENKGPLFSLSWPPSLLHNIYEEENDELKHYNERNDFIENPLDNCDYVKNVRLCISIIMKQNEDPICCLFVAGSLLSLV